VFFFFFIEVALSSALTLEESYFFDH